MVGGTGGGGGGAGGSGGGGSGYNGGNGGSGVVVVRYQIAEITASAKASGGAISFFNGKTIHTFGAGDFNNTSGSICHVEYVVMLVVVEAVADTR